MGHGQSDELEEECAEGSVYYACYGMDDGMGRVMSESHIHTTSTISQSEIRGQGVHTCR
jgi:hypothetical protein